MRKLLSVIMPVYNVELYVQKAIESVLNQTYYDLELIILNDGSTDNSLEICNQFKSDPRVFIYSHENIGLAATRNKGLNLAKGDYIAFIDSDDSLNINMYKILIDAIEKYDSDISMCDVNPVKYTEENPNSNIFLNNYEITTLDIHDIIDELYKNDKFRFEVWNKVFKSNILKDVKFMNGQVFEDIYFTRNYLKNINKVIHVRLPLHNYLISRSGNTNSSFNHKKINAIKELNDFANEVYNNEIDRKKINAIKLQFCIILGLQALMFKDKHNYKKLKRIFTKIYHEEKHNRFIKKWNAIIFRFSPRLYSLLINMR